MPDRAGPPGTGRDPVAGKIIEVVVLARQWAWEKYR